MTEGKWSNTFLDAKRKQGDALVDQFIVKFVEDINAFADAAMQTNPNYTALLAEHQQNRESYGHNAMQGVLHSLLCVPGVPVNINCGLQNYYTGKAQAATTDYDRASNEILAAYFQQDTPFGNVIEAYFDLNGDKEAWMHDARPAGVTDAHIQRGEWFYTRYNVEIGTILLCASLPFCYLDANGVPALVKTHALTNGVYNRLVETTRFVNSVMQPGGLARHDSLGVTTAKKIRLLHAYNRYRLLTLNSDPWQETLGLPINQEDLGLTLMTFATVILDSLRKLNVHISAHDEDAYFQCWRYVGVLLGIDADMIPDTAEDGRALMQAVAARQYRSSADGILITHSLLDFMQTELGAIGHKRYSGWPATKMRYLLGDAYADMLQVSNKNEHLGLLRFIRFVHGVEYHVFRNAVLFNKLTRFFGLIILEGLQHATRAAKDRPMFLISDYNLPQTTAPPAAK